jgi:hypothetical protein
MKGAEIVIYDEIGAFGIPAKAFLDELEALGPVAELTVRINSPGGALRSLPVAQHAAAALGGPHQLHTGGPDV